MQCKKRIALDSLRCASAACVGGVRVLGLMDQTVEEKRPNTHFKECPDCKATIEYWWTSDISACFPHFYCESCSNVFWRSSDRERVTSSNLSEGLAKRIASELPKCKCGGSYRAGANPKCPSCGHEFKHGGSINQRLTDPNVILLQGAIFTSES